MRLQQLVLDHLEKAFGNILYRSVPTIYTLYLPCHQLVTLYEHAVAIFQVINKALTIKEF